MKKSFLLFVILACNIVYSNAQEDQEIKTHSFKLDGANKMEIRLVGSGLEIEGYNGDEVVITPDGYIAPPERANGLRPLYNSFVDNTGIGLAIEKEGEVIKITTTSSKRSVDYHIKVPQSVALSIAEMNWDGNDILIKKMNSDLELDLKGSDVSIEDITGPVVASSISGSILVSFSKLNQDKPNSIKATSDFIDISLPADTKADLKLSSISGEIYTDFDLEIDESSNPLTRIGGGNTIETKLNGGGVALDLNAISGNVYLRKVK